MTLREAKRICEKSENLSVTYGRIKSAVKRLRRGTFSSRVYAPTVKYLRSRDYLLDRREFFDVICRCSEKTGFTYRELASAADHIVYAIYSDMDKMSGSELENALNSLRCVDLINTEKLYSAACAAEKYMNTQTESVFAECDRNTKNQIRARIIELSRKRGIGELEAARIVSHSDTSAAPVALKALYFVFMALVFCIFMLFGRVVVGLGWFVLLFCAYPISQTAKDMADRAFASLCRNDSLPKLKLDNIPDGAETLVVITTLLNGNDKRRFDDIEKYFLSNRYDNTLFGILADLPDSDSADGVDDENTIRYATARIDALNGKYGDHFALFIRERKYSAGEGKFIGWERKRGAICELVRLIKRYPNTFSTVICDRITLHKTKYIITLDSDTELYPAGVLDLIGAAEHPSNKAVIKNGKIVGGYGMFQPRMDTSLESAASTSFTSMLCGSGGVDVYSGAAFDVYQDVFGEGIFCGKGVISVDAYFALIDGFFPQDSILSHDLLEGERVRCAALTDIVLCDSVPENPLSYFKRLHRWDRGDVQSLLYLFGKVRDEFGKKRENPLKALSKYKIADNIRRLLVPVFTCAALIASAGYEGWRAVGAVLLALSYLLIRCLLSLPFMARNFHVRFFSFVLPSAGHVISNCAYETASLFHTAHVNIDAAFRSLFRMFVSKKKMLEWTVQETSDLLSKNSFPYYFLKMLPSVAVGLFMFIYSGSALHKIVGLFWVSMPFASFFLSKKHSYAKKTSLPDKKFLIDAARRHWDFLNNYTNDSENRLPPDNVQFEPFEKIAHRTSPTNIGLYLLSVVAARDFGFISSEYMQNLLRTTLNTVNKLEKWRGNLYNWYDTKTCNVIGDRFVSSVDSGNFVACLICAREGIKEYASELISLFDVVSVIDGIVENTDLGAFADTERELLSIGYDERRGRLLDGCYDLYMTECRTASYIAIAEGRLPREYWRGLARLLVSRDGYMGMLSWNGTMFEYFMPVLFLPIFRNSLEYESLRYASKQQYETTFGGVWGKSECGYPEYDGDGNYKYKAMGVSWLGMERKLDETSVIAPYASFLSLSVAAKRAVANLRRIKKKGGAGKYGFFESIDLSDEKKPVVTYSHMSHHVGMSIVAAANAVFGGIMQKRFISDQKMGAYTDLLKEKIPTDPKIIKVKNIIPESTSERDYFNLRYK